MKIKNWTALLLCMVLLTSALCPNVYAAANALVDLPAENHWSYKPILWAYEGGVTAGVDATHFGPSETLTRAQAVMMIYRWLGVHDPTDGTGPMPFVDVRPNAYYYKALQYAWENHWVAGISEDKFGPNEVCTRAQLVALLGKAFLPPPSALAEDEETPPVKDVRDFVDVPENAYYFNLLRMFTAWGVIAGTDATHFSPNHPCTRAQFVTILYRYDLALYS